MTNRADTRSVKFIGGENQVNPEEPNSDISWGSFIAALLLIPLFVITGIIFSIFNLIEDHRSRSITKG